MAGELGEIVNGIPVSTNLYKSSGLRCNAYWSLVWGASAGLQDELAEKKQKRTGPVAYRSSRKGGVMKSTKSTCEKSGLV